MKTTSQLAKRLNAAARRMKSQGRHAAASALAIRWTITMVRQGRK